MQQRQILDLSLIVWLGVRGNPKKRGSGAHARFGRYVSGQTVHANLRADLLRRDLYHDRDRGFIVLLPPGTEAPELPGETGVGSYMCEQADPAVDPGTGAPGEDRKRWPRWPSFSTAPAEMDGTVDHKTAGMAVDHGLAVRGDGRKRRQNFPSFSSKAPDEPDLSPEGEAARQRRLAVQTARASREAAAEVNRLIRLETVVQRAVKAVADRAAERRQALRRAEDGGWSPPVH